MQNTSLTSPQIPSEKADYWRIYHAPEALKRSDELRQIYSIQSTGVNLHIDAYEQENANAPVLIFNHGAGGYSRLFIPLILEIYDAGYTVVLPDQRGQGLSEGKRGDFTISQMVQNIVDVTHWAHDKYKGKLFIAGASQGGGLAYFAGVADTPITAMICHNLYDFSNAKNSLALSRFSPFAVIPGIPTFVKHFMQVSARILPNLKLNVMLLARFEKMVDERATDFYGQYKADPYPIRAFNLRYMASTFNTKPKVKLEDNTIPTLVINQTRDKMVSPKATRVNYERLGGQKVYAEIDYGHWAMGHGFEQEWVAHADKFMKQFL